MKEQFDILRRIAQDKEAPLDDLQVQTLLAVFAIAEQVVTDLHRVADALEKSTAAGNAVAGHLGHLRQELSAGRPGGSGGGPAVFMEDPGGRGGVSR